MNTIPTTLEAGAVPYTVVGAPKAATASKVEDARGLSVVLLNRGSRLYRGEALGGLARAGLVNVISVEPNPDAVDVESLSARYPSARFILLSEAASPGVQVNIAIRESTGPYVFVLWSDLSLAAQGLSSRFYERLAERDLLCRVPSLFGKGGEQIPSVVMPAMGGSSLKVLGLVPEREGARSLYPFDYTGIYSKEKFTLTGGFDAGLANPYWQKLDFGFRAWLWGEEIRLAQALKLSYADPPPPEDETPDEGYKWFWLKNLAPSFRGDSGAIGSRRFWSYLRSRRGRSLSALGEFRAAQDWVRLNRYRFRTDAASLVDLWEESD
jgi:hypothetical protein